MYNLILNADDLEVILMSLENMYDSIQEHYSFDAYRHMTTYIEVVGLIEHFKTLIEKGLQNE